jgi:hypothetical protein
VANKLHPIKSIEARTQSYVLNHFEKSKYAKRLRMLKDTHLGEMCFIIGNGPSLSVDDLEVLHKNNVLSFGFNRIFLMFDKTNWRPDFYVSQDEKMLFNCQDDVNNLEISAKLIPLINKYFHNIDIKDALYFNVRSSIHGVPVFSDSVDSYIGNSNTVAFSAAQIAVYMGFKKIYLLGVDHNFAVYQNDKGEIINDKSVKDYFTDEYNKDKENLYIPNLDASTRAFISMKKYCDEHGIEVYNATRGGKLEVFPRVDFDMIF